MDKIYLSLLTHGTPKETLEKLKELDFSVRQLGFLTFVQYEGLKLRAILRKNVDSVWTVCIFDMESKETECEIELKCVDTIFNL